MEIVCHMWIFQLLAIGSGLILVTAVDVTIEAGQAVTLECPLAENFPKWLGPSNDTPLTANGQVTAEGMEYVDDKHLKISEVMTSQAGDYKCQINNEEGVVTLIVKSFDFKIQFSNVRDRVVPNKPEDRVILAPVDDDVTFTCTVGNAFPQPEVTITIPDYGDSIDPSHVTTSSTNELDNTFTVVASVNVAVTADLDEKHIVCKATSGDKSRNVKEVIRVTYKPMVVIKRSSVDHSARTGTFVCSTMKSWPLYAIVWKLDGSESMPHRFEPAPTTCTERDDSFYDCGSNLFVGGLTKMDNDKTITCEFVFHGEFDSDHAFNIDLYFSPTMATIQEPGPVEARAGQLVTSTCSTDSARKGTGVSGVTFIWKLGSNVINVDVISDNDSPGKYGGFIASQTVSFGVTKSMNGATITCQARNGMSYKYVEDRRLLDVSYRPVLLVPFNNTIHVYPGDVLQLACVVDSNPVSSLAWSHNNNKISTDGSNSSRNTLIVAMSNARPRNAGTYTCTADNGVATVAGSVTVIVHDDGSTVPYAQYRNAIVVSVFVTFGVMLMALIVALFMVKRVTGRQPYPSRGKDLTAASAML